MPYIGLTISHKDDPSAPTIFPYYRAYLQFSRFVGREKTMGTTHTTYAGACAKAAGLAAFQLRLHKNTYYCANIRVVKVTARTEHTIYRMAIYNDYEDDNDTT